MLRHRCLIDDIAIGWRVEELAGAIARDLAGTPVMLVALLTGSFVFASDLARAPTRVGVDVRVSFVQVSHYGGTTDCDRSVEVRQDPDLELEDKAVLVVDDIVDTGASLALVREHVAQRRPAWLRTCAFLDKPSVRTLPLVVDYVGFEVPDRWLIGYGLDLAGEGRGLPYAATDVISAARQVGSELPNPLMALSFLALPVVPKLRLTDLHLVDVDRGSFVPLLVNGRTEPQSSSVGPWQANCGSQPARRHACGSRNG